MYKLIADTEYQRLIDVAVSSTCLKSLAVTLLIFTGARANEILSITTKSIDLRDGHPLQIKIKASKGGKTRTITLPEDIRARMRLMRDQLGEGSRTLAELINSGSKRIRTAYEILRRYFIDLQMGLWGVSKHTMHSLRHTMATRAFTSGMNIIQVKAILGHASLSSTGHYLAEYENSFVMDKIHTIVRPV